jgi:hypothetical protein
MIPVHYAFEADGTKSSAVKTAEFFSAWTSFGVPLTQCGPAASRRVRARILDLRSLDLMRACRTDRRSQRCEPRTSRRQFGDQSMSLSSARNYALRASKSQDQKEAIELLSKAIMELGMSIEATDAKVKKINKGT